MLKRRGRIQCGQPNRPSAAGDGNAFRLSGLLLPSSFYLWRILPRLFSRSGAAESAPIVPPQSPPADTVTPSTTADSGSQASGGIMSNGTTNSEGTVNGDAESSKMASTMTDPTFFALNLTSYIFNVGYLGSHWADIHLTFFDTGAHLHRIILARSPYLAHMMMNAPPRPTVHLCFPDENVTAEAVHIALQHLYNPSQQLVTATNARSVLATAFFFQGMPELVHHAYTVCRESVSPETVIDFVQWLGSAPLQQNGQPDLGMSFGSVNPQEGRKAGISESTDWMDPTSARYGDWSVRLKQDVLHFLIQVLPLPTSEPPASGINDPLLTSTFARLPFDLFKLCVESPDLPLDSVQLSFNLAKRVIAQRKKLGTVGNMDEAVVLAIRGGDGVAAIHITRKPKKRSALWKVEG